MTPNGPRRQPALTVYSAWNSFQVLCDTSSPLTARAYLSDVEDFAGHCRLPPEEALYELLRGGPEAARARVTAWSKAMVRRLAGNTVSRRVSALKSFVTHAGADGLVDWKLNVVSTHRQKSALSKESKIATGQRDMSGPQRADFEKLIAVLGGLAAHPPTVGQSEGVRLTAIRDLAMIGLLENPALRRSEVCALDVRDFRGGPTATVKFVGKGRSEAETLPVPPRVAGFIERWLAVRVCQRADPLFTRFRRPQFGPRAGQIVLTNERISGSSLYRICVDRGAQAIGTGKKGDEDARRRVNPHALRHTGVTKLADLHARGTLTLKQAMAVSRHKKPDTFLRYVDVTAAAARTAVNAMEAMR